MDRVRITPYAYWDGREIHIYRPVGKKDKAFNPIFDVWGRTAIVSIFTNKRNVKMYDIIVASYNGLTWSQAVDLAQATYRFFSEKIK